jgi:hypothetical protein
MKLTFAVLVLAAACGKVSHPGGGNGDGGPGDGDGGGADANPITMLSVTLEVGTGGGTVVSDVGNIDCGSSCDATLDTGTEVTFTATPDPGSSFVAWRGAARDCRRATECTITLTGGPQEVGALFAQKGTSAWAVHVGSSVLDRMGKVVIDKNGDLFVAASYGAAFEFAGQSYDSQGSQDIFVAKLSPGGEVLWAKVFGSAEYDEANFIAADPTTGDLVLGGSYQGAIDFGGPEPLGLADTKDLYVVKLSGDDGGLLWQLPLEVSDVDEPGFEGLGVDPSGDIIIGGHFNTSIDLGSTPLTTTPGEQEMFLAKLRAADGGVAWQRKLGGPNYPIPYELVVDGSGNAIMTGTFSDAIDLDGAAGNDMTANGTRDAFVAKFSGANGSLTWQRQIGGNEPNDGGGVDGGFGIALGPNNSVVVLVQYRVVTGEPVQFLANNLTGAGTGVDLVVGRISAAGGYVWGKRFGGAGDENGYRVATFQDGRVVVTGSFDADFSMGSDSLAYSGALDSFFGVLAANNGNALWAAPVICTAQDFGNWVAGYDSTLYAFGQFQETATFAGKALEAVGNNDGYGFAVALP